MNKLRLFLIFLILTTLIGCGPLEALSESTDKIKESAKFDNMVDALDSLSPEQLGEMGSDTQAAYKDYLEDKELLAVAEEAFKEATQNAKQLSEETADTLFESTKSFTGDITINDATAKGWDIVRCGALKAAYNVANFVGGGAASVAEKEIPVISTVAGAIANGTESLKDSTVDSVLVMKKAELDKAQKAYNDSYTDLLVVGAKDKALSTYIETGMTPTDVKNNKIGTIVLIVLAILFLILILIVFRRPKVGSQSPVVATSTLAPAVSNDVNVDYEALLHTLCEKHGKNYDAVLKSFNGDVRRAVEKMKLL